MDEFVFWLILFFVFIVLPFGFGFLLYFIPKKLGFIKTGIAFSVGYFLLLFGLLLYGIFEDDLFTKNQAKDLLETENIYLKDDFKILENESNEFFHRFELEISADDKTALINKIKMAKNFKPEKDTITFIESKLDRYLGPEVYKNYETVEYFIHERFKPNGEGYLPTWITISVAKTENKLMYKQMYEF